MGIFTSKRNVSAFDWWNEFDNSSTAQGVWNSYVEVVLNTLFEKENIDASRFKDELWMVRTELVSCAYQHLSNDSQSIKLELGLKKYAESTGKHRLYEDITKYNKFVADCASKWVNPNNTTSGENKMQLLNLKRVNFFKKHYKPDGPDKPLARVGNRIDTNYAMQNGFLIGSMTNFFVAKTPIEKSNAPQIEVVLNGFYSGGREALKKVKIDE